MTDLEKHVNRPGRAKLVKDVREKKLVKPVALTLLPQEIKMIENTKKRKELFMNEL